MTRALSPVELKQRQEAALKSGAYSGAVIVPLSAVLYRRLRKSVNRAVGRTTPAERRQLQYLSIFEARILQAERWLAAQPDELFADRDAGQIHPLVERVDGWVEKASRIVARLPARVARALAAEQDVDLSRALASARRASGQ